MRGWVILVGLMLVLTTVGAPARVARADSVDFPAPASNAVVRWNGAALQGVRDSRLGPPMVARALAIIHTCMFDAWSVYDPRAIATRDSGLAKRAATDDAKVRAVSAAAFRALVDLMPVDEQTVYRPLLSELGVDIEAGDPSSPEAVGTAACEAVLAFRHHDGANQLGDLHAGAYSDYTGYAPVNPPSGVPVDPASVLDIGRWQPLQYRDATGAAVTQVCVGGQWAKVTPFALAQADQFRPSAPPRPGTPAFTRDARELVQLSKNLGDRDKMIAEYWANGPRTETPPGHWNLFAQYVAARDAQTLDDDVKMFFVLNNALFDASIAAWDAKRHYDFARPVTVLATLFAGERIEAWGGPFQGTVRMTGESWIPYQPSTFPTPPFQEYVSGHSTFSAAAAAVLHAWTGSDYFGASVTLPAGSSTIEPGAVPARDVTLHWHSFSAAADEAGLSRRYGGIHFRTSDLAGRALGRAVGERTLAAARRVFGP